MNIIHETVPHSAAAAVIIVHSTVAFSVLHAGSAASGE